MVFGVGWGPTLITGPGSISPFSGLSHSQNPSYISCRDSFAAVIQSDISLKFFTWAYCARMRRTDVGNWNCTVEQKHVELLWEKLKMPLCIGTMSRCLIRKMERPRLRFQLHVPVRSFPGEKHPGSNRIGSWVWHRIGLKNPCRGSNIHHQGRRPHFAD
jgi:hypothetical protein